MSASPSGGLLGKTHHNDLFGYDDLVCPRHGGGTNQALRRDVQLNADVFQGLFLIKTFEEYVRLSGLFYPTFNIAAAETKRSETNEIPNSLNFNDLESQLSSDTQPDVMNWMDNVGNPANSQIGLTDLQDFMTSHWGDFGETTVVDPMENIQFTTVAGIGSQDTNSLLATTAPASSTNWATSFAPIILQEQAGSNDLHKSPDFTPQTSSKAILSPIISEEGDDTSSVPVPRNSRLATPLSIHLVKKSV
ncbi:hypothetical protein PG984_013486 [Apiospora sp. TS-2023a]